MNNAPIGIFDSGFGGLSVYQSIQRALPDESIVYVGDHAYLPYGGKTKTEIKKRAKKLIQFLLSKNCKCIVVACNTATIAGIDEYRTWFRSVPIIGVVPVVKTAAAVSKRNAFAVLSTAFTAKSSYQYSLIKKFAPTSKVYNLGCPNLLSFVEQGIVHGKTIDKELRSLLTPQVIRAIDVVVLGCTHYPFLQGAIRAIVGEDIQLLDSGGAVARHVTRILTHNGILAEKGKHAFHDFFTSGKGNNYSRVASILLGGKVQVRYANI